MCFPPEVSNGSHFRKVVVFMEGIRIIDKVKISFLPCCLMPSPSNFTLDDSILVGCDAASLGNWLLTFWALQLMPLYLVPITHWCDIISQKNGIVSNTTVKARNLHLPTDHILPWKGCRTLDVVRCLIYVLYTCLGMWNFSCFQAMNFNCTGRSMLVSVFVMLVVVVV